NFNYSSFAFDSNFRHGLTNYLTVESRLAASESLQLVGLGGAVRLGLWGVLSGAYTQSFYHSDSGNKYNIGYQYLNKRFNFNIQHEKHSEEYRNLSNLR